MSLDFKMTLQRGVHRWQLQARLATGPNVLIGPSGAGKTTLLDAVAGLLKPTEGFIRLDGRSLVDMPAKIFMPAHQRGLGFAFQDDRLFPLLTVQKNLAFGLKHRGDSPLEFQEVIAGLELEPLLQRHPEALSGGEKKRVGLGRALLAARTGLLLDEPFAGLNPQLASRVAEFVVHAAARIPGPTLIVTHHQEALPDGLPVLALTEGQLGPA